MIRNRNYYTDGGGGGGILLQPNIISYPIALS
jgi:hypothetical protein